MKTPSGIEQIARSMREAHTRKRRIETAAFLGLVAGGAALSFFIFFLLDYATLFPSFVRVSLSLAILGVFAVFLPWRRSRLAKTGDGLIEMAREIELKAEKVTKGGFYSVLVSATEFASKGEKIGGSIELRQQVIGIAHAPNYDPAKLTLHDTRLVKNSSRLFIAALLIYLLWMLLGSNSLGTFFSRAAGFSARYLTRTRIETVIYPKFAPQHKDLNISVKAAGLLPVQGKLVIRFDGESQFTGTLTQEKAGSANYIFTVKAPSKNFSFDVRLGDDNLTDCKVTVLPSPFCEKAQITLKPPQYTQVPASTFEMGGFEMLEGGKFEMTVTPNREVETCELELGNEKIKMEKSGKNYITHAISPKETCNYSVRLRDKFGIENEDRLQYQIFVLKDHTPIVSLDNPEQGAFYAPLSKMKWKISASDDYGMGTVSLKYMISKRSETGDTLKVRDGELKLAELGDHKESNINGTIKLQELKLEPEQILEITAVIKDKCATHPDGGLSQPKTVNIVSPEELKRMLEDEQLGLYKTLKDVEADMKLQKTKIEILEKKGYKP